MTHLASSLVSLRPLGAHEASAVFDAVAESRDTVGKWMSWATATYSLDDARTWIDTCNEERKTGLSHEFGIFDPHTQQLLGVAGFNQFNRVNRFCNLGYWIRRSAQRKGFALAALKLLRPYAFEHLGLARVEIVVAEGNEPSAALALKSGAHFEGMARHRLMLHGKPVHASMFSYIGP